jgi:hypothetical protein
MQLLLNFKGLINTIYFKSDNHENYLLSRILKSVHTGRDWCGIKSTRVAVYKTAVLYTATLFLHVKLTLDCSEKQMKERNIEFT